ncbi:MAG TPA: HisS family protein [Aggregatilineales bacterium]|nr:histidine--tRNA ligase family protein [Anaerolineales bacterium]HRE49175.1 HisS family protein [Aggregatilineales bacterium]
MPTPTYTRPPGFYDRAAAESAQAAAITATLHRVFARFGYQQVETPLVEYADLFLTKSGDDAMSRLFTFEMYGRLLCLRSEFTPSAARLYVERHQHDAKPIRWGFSGSVFRYESPGRGHSRQFTMIGAELIGGSGASADAEVIGMAAAGLFALGVQAWTIAIGHVGLMSALLRRFNLERRTQRHLLGQAENLRKRGRDYVEGQLDAFFSGLPTALKGEGSSSEREIERTLQLLLASADLGTTGSGRSSEDIARRLLAKQRRADSREDVRRALDFLETFVAIEGTPSHALPELARLLPDDPSVLAEFETLQAAVKLLSVYDLAEDRISIQPGLARGLNYYTGIVFEGHTPAEDSSSQLCGGGRYDDYIRVIGAAQDTPAVGFAFGLERILAELARQAAADAPLIPPVQALVVPLTAADEGEAARVATVLRRSSAVELVMPPPRTLSGVLGRAAKRNIPYVILVGGAEQTAGRITLRDMARGEQTTLPLEDAARLIAAHDANTDTIAEGQS